MARISVMALRSWLSGEEEQLRHVHHSLLVETTSSFPRVNGSPTLLSVSHCRKHLGRYRLPKLSISLFAT